MLSSRAIRTKSPLKTRKPFMKRSTMKLSRLAEKLPRLALRLLKPKRRNRPLLNNLSLLMSPSQPMSPSQLMSLPVGAVAGTSCE